MVILKERRNGCNVSALNSKYGGSGIVAETLYSQEVAICRRKVRLLMKKYIGPDGRFSDPKFSILRSQEMLLIDPNQNSEKGKFVATTKLVTGWKRISDIVRGTAHLFIDGMVPSDIKQGKLGDCWLVSSLSVLSQDPERLRKCLVEYDEQVGIYGFVFFKHGHWISVVIDDWMPVGKNGQLLFGRCSDKNETWVSLYEKAMAKLHGGYEGIVRGGTTCGMIDLSGGITRKYSLPEASETERNEILSQFRHMGKYFFFGCSIHSAGAASNGLVKSHAYGIIGFYEGYGETLIKIRNPWGNSKEWTGKWSDNCPSWKSNSDIKKAVEFKSARDGTFWMNWEDFSNTFTTVFATFVFPPGQLFSLLYAESQSRKSSYSFTITQDQFIGLAVEQRDRSFGQMDLNYPPLGFTISANDNSFAYSLKPKTIRSRGWWALQPLKAGEYTITVNLKESNIPFYIRLYADNEVPLTPLS